jgi:hypothetical protein
MARSLFRLQPTFQTLPDGLARPQQLEEVVLVQSVADVFAALHGAFPFGEVVETFAGADRVEQHTFPSRGRAWGKSADYVHRAAAMAEYGVPVDTGSGTLLVTRLTAEWAGVNAGRECRKTEEWNQ